MELSLFRPGRELLIEYPSHNLLGTPIEYVERRILVKASRDFRDVPIAAAAFVKRPLVRRGSILIFADDLGLGEVGRNRKFWFEAIRGPGEVSSRELPSYRLGIYDPGRQGELVDWVSRSFEPTASDRLAMMVAIRRLDPIINHPGGFDLQLAAYPVLEGE